jgi:hypothetical protein
MAEDEETATARYIASNVFTQMTLKTMFEFWGDLCVYPAICSLTDVQIQVKTVC